jgi:hypothetical protein
MAVAGTVSTKNCGWLKTVSTPAANQMVSQSISRIPGGLKGRGTLDEPRRRKHRNREQSER